MITNFDSLINLLKEEISAYKSSSDYKGNKAWKNIVSGIEKSIYIIEQEKKNTSYSKALSDFHKDELLSLKMNFFL